MKRLLSVIVLLAFLMPILTPIFGQDWLDSASREDKETILYIMETRTLYSNAMEFYRAEASDRQDELDKKNGWLKRNKFTIGYFLGLITAFFTVWMSGQVYK